MGKKVYFAGSIRGGRQDAELYNHIIKYIQRSHTVLTEHVGDLSKSKTDGVEDSDVAIYEQDTAWLREADLTSPAQISQLCSRATSTFIFILMGSKRICILS